MIRITWLPISVLTALSCASSTSNSYQPYTSTYQAPTYDWKVIDINNTFTPLAPPKRPGCTGWDCREQFLVVTYNLDEVILDAEVVVEAFDNPQFLGAPSAETRLTPFDAYRPGAMVKGSIWLKPGRYYLRAFLEPHGADAGEPFVYEGLQLVKGRAIGILGALSAPQLVELKAKTAADHQTLENVAFISLSHLFRETDSPFGTKAHFRFKLSYAACAAPDGCAEIPIGTKVIVRLLETADLELAPTMELKVPIEALMVTTRPGVTEVLSPELPLGAFAAYAFIDMNGNTFMDEGEPGQIFGTWDDPAWAKTKRDATPTLTLNIEDM